MGVASWILPLPLCEDSRSDMGAVHLTKHVCCGTMKNAMTRIFLLGLLCLSVLCMVPLMESHHLASDHLHHDVSASCATCMGSEVSSDVFFLLTLLGLWAVMIPVAPLLALVKGQFHPPRIL